MLDKLKLNKFEWTLIIGIILINIIVFIVTKDINAIGIISSITGVICVVMTARGSITCYYWGIINIATYVIIAWQTSFYGEVMLNGLYYLPMQFVGILLWRKNLNKDTNIVKTKKMSINYMICISVISIVAILGYGIVLRLLNGNQPLIDSTTNVLSIVAMFLSVKRYKEQWIMWILVDIVTIYMWTNAFIGGEANSLVMVFMWGAYLINAVYGYINWTKLEGNKEVCTN